MTGAPALNDGTGPAAGGARGRSSLDAGTPVGGARNGAAPDGAGRESGLRRGAAGTGIALGLLSAAAFGTSGTFGTALIGAGWSPAGAVFARVLVAAVVLTGPALVQLRGRWSLLRRWGWRTVAYGFFGVATCQLGYFNAIARMPVGIALLLEYMGILFVVGWLWLRHGQRPRRLTVAGSAAALGGLALMLDLSGAGGVNPVGAAWALLAAVSMAIYFVLSAWSGPESSSTGPLPPVVMTWGGMVVGAVALGVGGATGVAPLAFSAADVTLLGHRVSWLVPVLGLSVLAAAFAYVTGIGAARRLGAKLGSFVAMAEVLFATAFAWVLLHQVPSGTQFLGGALILLGVVLVRLDEA